MRLGELHPDMERYLAEDCYCPGEIYDITGFSYMLFNVDDECYEIAANEERSAVVATTSNGRELSEPQALMFWHDEPGEFDKIVDAQRVDATDNNIAMMEQVVAENTAQGFTIDEFRPGAMAADMRRLFDLCDGIIVS